MSEDVPYLGSALAILAGGGVVMPRKKTPAGWSAVSVAILFLIISLANVRWFWAGT